MDDNPFVICPYNPQHRMLKLRLQSHIIKCQKNYITAGMKPCPYNATHIVSSQDYRKHIQSCPDSRLIEEHMYSNDDVHGKLNEGKFHFEVDVHGDEDWESAADVTDSCSQVSNNSCKEYNEYMNLLADYDEDDEPLQKYFFEEKRSARLSNDSASGRFQNQEEVLLTSEKHNNEAESENKETSPQDNFIYRYGAGRGRLLSLLESLNKD